MKPFIQIFENTILAAARTFFLQLHKLNNEFININFECLPFPDLCKYVNKIKKWQNYKKNALVCINHI